MSNSVSAHKLGMRVRMKKFGVPSGNNMSFSSSRKPQLTALSPPSSPTSTSLPTSPSELKYPLTKTFKGVDRRQTSFRSKTLMMCFSSVVLLGFTPGAVAAAAHAESTAILSSSSNIRAELATAKLNPGEVNGPSPFLQPTIAPETEFVVSDDPFTNSTPSQLNETEEFWQGGSNNNSQVTFTSTSDNYLYDVPLYLVVLLSLLYGAISVCSVIGNVLVLWVVTVSRRMRTKTNFFIANLALADIIIAIFAIPFQFQAALLQRWNLPDFMCAFCPFVQVLSVNLSVFTLSVIAMDRYRAIITPFKSIRISKREAFYALISIWSLSIFIALPQELDYKVIEEEDRGIIKPFCAPVLLSPTFRQYYMFGLVVIQYVLPLLIISVAYTRMATKLWGTNAPGNKEESRDENTLRNKKKVVKMLAVVVLLFALCWLPLQMYNFFQSITTINEYQYINIIWFCFHWLAMSNSCYNPFIYAIYSDKFQTEFKSRLPCFRVRRRDPDDGGFCSEASDYGPGGSRIRPTAMSRSVRSVRSSTRREAFRTGSVKVDNHRSRSIELQDGMSRSRPGTNSTITTISEVCNNMKTTALQN